MPTDAAVAILFANSRYAVRGRPQEGIGTSEDLAAWLRDHLGSPNVTVTRVDAAIELRDAIRSVFHACVNGEPPPADALAVINKAAASAPVWPELTPAYELSEHTASERDDQAVRQKLPPEPSSRSTEGKPGTDLTLMCRPTRQKQTGHIQTRQTQQHTRHSEKHPQWLGELRASERGMALRCRTQHQ